MPSVEPTAVPHPSEPPLTVRRVIRFTLPLAMTFLMMSGSAPIVTAGIAWTFGAEGERTHLAAFLMMFSTALFLYSPAFVARNTAIRMVIDRRSLVRFLVGNLSWAMISCGLLLAIAWHDEIGNMVFLGLFDARPTIATLARQGLALFAPMPLLIVLRGLGQGCHISNNDGWHVGIGTTLRLCAMALYVFGYAVHHERSGPVLGGEAFLLGIGVETAYVLLMLRGKPQWQRQPEKPILNYGQFARYAGPLMLAAAWTQLVTPMLIRLISTARMPAESQAGYDLIRGSMWVMLSVLNCIQPTVLAHATSRHNFRVILRYAVLMVIPTTTLVAVVSLTPLRHTVYEGWLRVDNVEITRLLYAGLRWVLPLPTLMIANLAIQGLHTRSGRTGWVTAGTAAGLALLAVFDRLIDVSAWDGLILAVAGFTSFHVVSVAVQLIGLLHGGLTASLSPRELSEQMALDRNGHARG